MMEAFEQLWSEGDDVQLVIVGRIGWLMGDFVEALENHPQQGLKLFWLTEASDEFLAKIYESCSCLLAASIDEGFGLPLVEAMYYGKPVLARDIEVFRETGGANYKYFGYNKNEIVDCIRKISLSQETALKKNNSIRMNKWETHVQQLEEKIRNYLLLRKLAIQPSIKKLRR
jgi:glycosyltransferase involved in cell wall biosynthesis